MRYPYRAAPHAEVSGACVSALSNHLRQEEVVESLVRYHLNDVDANSWYSATQCMALISEWVRTGDGLASLVSVGTALVYHLEFPPEIEHADSVQKLLSIGDLHMAHQRNEGVGGYVVEQVGPKHIRYTENTLWPDDLIYGFVYEAARRYLPHGTHFVVRFDPAVQKQDQGGQHTVIDLTWE